MTFTIEQTKRLKRLLHEEERLKTQNRENLILVDEYQDEFFGTHVPDEGCSLSEALARHRRTSWRHLTYATTESRQSEMIGNYTEKIRESMTRRLGAAKMAAYTAAFAAHNLAVRQYQQMDAERASIQKAAADAFAALPAEAREEYMKNLFTPSARR